MNYIDNRKKSTRNLTREKYVNMEQSAIIVRGVITGNYATLNFPNSKWYGWGGEIYERIRRYCLTHRFNWHMVLWNGKSRNKLEVCSRSWNPHWRGQNYGRFCDSEKVIPPITCHHLRMRGLFLFWISDPNPPPSSHKSKNWKTAKEKRYMKICTRMKYFLRKKHDYSSSEWHYETIKRRYMRLIRITSK